MNIFITRLGTMAQRLVSIGEAMIELSHQTADAWSQGFAGDTLNTAWAARALLPGDWAVDFVTRIGQDGFSDRFVEMLSDANIGTDHIIRSDSRIMGLYSIETDSEGERTFTYWRNQSAARELARDPHALAKALSEASMVYVSGITLAILSDADRATLINALGQRSERSFKVYYDANARPKLWESTGVMQRSTHKMAQIAEAVLPTFDDEQLVFGDKSLGDTLERYSRNGVPTIVIKNGTDPTVLKSDGIVTEIPVLEPVSPKDTTGAGDSFNGAFMAARAAGRSDLDCVRVAQAASAEVVQHKGALVAHDVIADAVQKGTNR